jgi:autotransporter-associated beta strand protein
MKRFLSSAAIALLTAAVLSLPSRVSASQIYWGGYSNLNWSTVGNWAPGMPGSSDSIDFGEALNTGYTNATGAVNNMVDTSFTVGAITYTANSSNTAPLLGKHFYTTLIPSNSVLTLSGGVGEPTLLVGNGVSGNFSNYTTIAGAGGLVVNNPASRIEVQQVSRATLDLSGLSNFTANIANLWVGASPNNSGQSGYLFLAQTNAITTAPNPGAPGILIARSTNSGASGVLTLGQVNTFNTDGLVVSGTRGNGSGTRLGFSAGAANPSLTLRGSAGGSSRAAIFSIGDISAEENDYLAPLGGNASGVADFTGGILDIKADSINVARSCADVGSGGNFTTAAGSLIVERGTVDANNVFIAYKQGTNGSYASSGALTLKSNATMVVNQNVSLAFRAGVTNGPVAPIGTLAVNDNATLIVGGNITHGDGAVSTLSLGGGTINLTNGGNVYAYGLGGFGTITGANNITITNNFVVGPVSAAGTLNLSTNLILANPFPIVFDLGPTNTPGSGINDLLNVGGNVSFNNNPVSFTYGGPLLAGSNYTVIAFSGSRTGLLTYTNDTRSPLGLDQSTPGQVNLVVTNWTPATLVWQGTTANTTNVWSTGTNLYWTNTAAGADQFYQGDSVIFDDTAINPTIYPNGKLFPVSITINCSTKNIVITNRSQAGPYSGVIGGGCSITKNGTGTVTFGTYSNTFTGPINVNNGIWRLYDPNFATPADRPTLGSINSPMYINSGATLDFAGVGSTATGKPLIIAGNGFNGLGAITNSGSGAANGFAVTLAGDARVSADNSVITLKSAAPGTTSPPFSGLLNLNGFTLTKLGANRFSLQDVVATNSGYLNLGGGNLSIANCIVDGPGSLNLSNGTFLSFGFSSTLSTAGYVGKPINAYNVGLVANIANSPSPAVINSTVNLLGTLSVTNTQPVVMNGAISGANGIIKYGTSNLVLNAANNYSGPTIITAGGLALGTSGSIATSPLIQITPGALLDVTAKPSGLSLASGQTLALDGSAFGNLTVASSSTLLGSGIIVGSLTVSPGAEVAPATTNVTGTIIVSNNLTLAGGHFTWEMAPSFDISDALLVGGNLTLTGTNTFTVNSIGGFDPSGTNTLITYSGTLTGGLTNLAVNSSARFSVEFVDPAVTPGSIKIRLVTPSPNIVWTGTNTLHPTFWDVKTTTNWNNGGTPDIFWSSDAVAFDDTAGTNVVDLIGTLGPSSVEMANNSSTYYFRGAGSLVTASLTNDGTGFVISNTANNFFTGAGLVINSGNVTFSQPTNVSLTANLIGSGTFTKAGNSNLTLTGNSANFSGPFNIVGGTLRAGNSNVLGTGNATVSSGATLDINGQILSSSASVAVAGLGTDGFGAINNRGAGRTNALANVTLTADTTFGALSNAWGIVNGLTGGGFGLTKTNANDVWLMTGSDTDLGTLNVKQGRLVFSAAGTTLGRPGNPAIVAPNATLAFATTNTMPQSGTPPPSFDAGAKPLVLSNNAALESIGFGFNLTSTNIHSGPITITNNANFRVGGNSQLILNGPISGSNGIVVLTNGGTLILTGTNTYTSNTVVYSGTLVLSNSSSLPTNTTLILSNNITTFGNPALQFVNSPVFASNNILRFTAQNAAASIGGDGTWLGPTFMFGSSGFTFSGGTNLLNFAGPLITTNAGGSVNFHGSNTRLAGPLVFSGTVSIGVGDGLSAGFNERFTTVRFDSTNNWTSLPNFERGRIIIGTNNALPPGVPFNQINTLSSGVSDRRVIFDLNGYNQTLSSIKEVVIGGVNGLNLIGNSSSNSDSTFTYAGTGTNTWGIQLVDTLDNPIVPRKLGLTVTSGLLELLNTNTYTGPTLVSGGKLLVSTLKLNAISTVYGSLDASPVTVNGAGSFGGNGSVAGSVTIGSGGTLTPGDSYSIAGIPVTRIGQLTLQGTDLTFGTGSRGIFEVDLGAGTNDQVVGIGTLTYGGSLVISNIGAQPFANGVVIKLFDAAAYVAGPITIQPPSPGPGLMWDASNLAVDGTLHVATTIAPIVNNPTRRPDGNISFQINGVMGQGYSVLASTNIALPFSSWPIIQSGSLPSSSYLFNDLNATNFSRRFYLISSP